MKKNIYLNFIKNNLISTSLALAVLASVGQRPYDENLLWLSFFLAFASNPKGYISSIFTLDRFKFIFITIVCSVLLIIKQHGIEDFVSFHESGDRIFFTFIYILHFTSTFKIATKSDFKKFELYLYLITNAISFIAIAQYFGILATTAESISTIYYYAPVYRSTGFLPHSTALTIWFLTILLILNNTYIFSKIRPLKYFTIAMVILGIGTTMGRMGLVLALCIILYELTITINKKITSKINLKFVLAISVVTLTTAISYNLARSKFKVNTEPTRFANFFNFESTHSQRLVENYLGLLILNKFPLGTGHLNVSKVAEEIRTNHPTLKLKIWIFDKWHGIHNGFLHYASFWGAYGLYIVLALILLPILLKGFSSSSILTSLVFFLYLLTDNIFYREITSVLALAIVTSTFISNELTTLQTELNKNALSIKIKSLVILIIVSIVAFNIYNLRKYQILSQTKEMVPVYNPMFYSYYNDQLTGPYNFDINNFFSLKYIYFKEFALRYKKDPDEADSLKKISRLTFNLSSNLNYTKYLNYNALSLNHPNTVKYFNYAERFSQIISLNVELPQFDLFNSNEINDDPKFVLYGKQLHMFVNNRYNTTNFYECWEPFWFDYQSGKYLNTCNISTDYNYRPAAYKYVFSRLKTLFNNIMYQQ